MTPVDCRYETDVVDAIVSCRWPDRADAALRAHVASCSICADVAEVASALHLEHDVAWTDAAAVPPAALVWLRAQGRAKAEAARQAARPIAVMQAIGLASAAAILSLAIGFVAYWVWARADWLLAVPAVDSLNLATMGFAVRGILLAVGLWLVLAPVAVYLVAADD